MIRMSLRDAWEKEAENWIRFARTPGHDRTFWRFGLPHFLALLPAPEGLTLDVGCGEGRLPLLLRERGFEVIGIDASSTLIRKAAEDGARRYAVADGARLPLRAECARLVTAYMSLQDMDDLGGAVREVGRILSPRGRFCFSILHPIATAGGYSERKADAPFIIEDSYLTPRRYTYHTDRGGIPMTFASEHRPLEAYFRALEDAGLQVERFLEPPIADDFVMDDETELRWVRLPIYLFVRAVKPH
jgi:SAM-dependent methyltransferase